MWTQDGQDDYVDIQTLDDQGNKTLWFKMDQQGKMITIQTLDQGTPKQTIQLDNNKHQIHLYTDNTEVLLDEDNQEIDIIATKEVLVKSKADQVVVSAGTVVRVGDEGASIPAAMLGSIDSRGHRIVAFVAKKVLVK
jgi:hypothetical protein